MSSLVYQWIAPIAFTPVERGRSGTAPKAYPSTIRKGRPCTVPASPAPTRTGHLHRLSSRCSRWWSASAKQLAPPQVSEEERAPPAEAAPPVFAGSGPRRPESADVTECIPGARRGRRTEKVVPSPEDEVTETSPWW